jgi:hypothetical protein
MPSRPDRRSRGRARRFASVVAAASLVAVAVVQAARVSPVDQRAAAVAAVSRIGSAAELPVALGSWFGLPDPDGVRLVAVEGPTTYWAVADDGDVCFALSDTSGFAASGCTPVTRFVGRGMGIGGVGSATGAYEAYLLPAGVRPRQVAEGWRVNGGVVLPVRYDDGPTLPDPAPGDPLVVAAGFVLRSL